jgi:hypothetical protein
MERGDEHSLLGTLTTHQLREGVGHVSLLEVDVEQGIGKGLQQLVEAGNSDTVAAPGEAILGFESITGIEELQVLPSPLGNLAYPVGEPLQLVVVERNHNPVGGDVSIGLQIAVSEINSSLKGLDRVLGPQVTTAAMSEADRMLMSEIGMEAHTTCPSLMTFQARFVAGR